MPIWCHLTGDPKPPSYKRTLHTMPFELLRTSPKDRLPILIQWDESTGMPQDIKLLAVP